DFLEKHLTKIIGQNKDSFNIAKQIFRYVQDSFATGHIWTGDFEEIVKNKKAESDHLNIFLCALYRHAGLSSDLIYISTDRKHPLVPDKVQEKNTTIAVRVVINGISYFCNPAVKNLPFGYLPYR